MSLNRADWMELAGEPQEAQPLVDATVRLRWGTRWFVLGALLVLARAITLELTQGDVFRSTAAEPLVRRQSLMGTRGRLLARDGTVLAVDLERPALAIHYRWLQSPPNALWLRRQARARLRTAQRKDRRLVQAAESRVLRERRDLHARLAQLCEISDEQWLLRATRIQQRVEQIARHVNDRHRQQARPKDADAHHDGWWQRVSRRFDEWFWWEEGTEAPLVVAEEVDQHVIAEEVSLAVVAEVEGHPDLYPGVRIEPRRRRAYPLGMLAANLIGHLGAPDENAPAAGKLHPDDRVGRLGLELKYEKLLHGQRGTRVEHLYRTGETIFSRLEQTPGVGRDITLTLDLALQRTAEQLLAAACQRRDVLADALPPAGGAAVVLNVQSGAVLAAASAPRFDPNLFSGAGQAQANGQIERLLADPAHPLFDRTTRMAIAPGSVFKPITAAALLETGQIDPESRFHCRGYLHRPEAQRCAIFARRGVGHGGVNLSDALAVSCNVYFFQAAVALGAQPLIDWADRFGLGQATGIDLPYEAAGQIPQPQRGWTTADTQALAIGQSRLAVTPMQMARVMAALANGGLLVEPHLVNSVSPLAAGELPEDSPFCLPNSEPQSVPGLNPATLAMLRESLTRVVSHPDGTAHETVYLEQLPMAGKTGTAQAGAGLPDHAWFTAYVPADAPKAAIVVALEHAGDGGAAAGPVARRLAERMLELGYFPRHQRSANRKSDAAQ